MKQFDAEFKREAVRLASEPGMYARKVERELGLYQGAIRHWRDQLTSPEKPTDVFPGKGRQSSDKERLLRLERENRILREERDILKKAVAVFSTDPHRYSGS